MADPKPDRILKELADLWITMGKPDAGETSEDGGVLRACAMTLISFVDDEEDAMAHGQTLAMLMREHPSRAIVVRLRDGDDALEARVFAQCWMPFGHQRQICCEQVEISASMNRLADIRSIVAPLAVPDLPRVIWLRSGRIVRAGGLRKILSLGDKIIVDSSRPGAPGFGELGGLLDAGHIAGDLAWTRLTGLRQLLAQLADGRDPSVVTIEYGGREASPEARYLAAWLQNGLPGASVSLKSNGSPGDGRPSTIRIDHDLSVQLWPGCAEYEVGSLRQHANLPAATEEHILNEELGIVSHDQVFEKALNRITA